MAEVNPLGMSDEEFLKNFDGTQIAGVEGSSAPAKEDTSVTDPAKTDGADPEAGKAPEGDATPAADPSKETDPKADEKKDADLAPDGSKEDKGLKETTFTDPKTTPKDADGKSVDTEAKKADGVDPAGSKKDDPAKKDASGTAPADGAPIDYKAGYEKLLAPVKSNGKEIEVKSLEDARRLMSQGIDYTRKSQELARYRKTIMTLQQNGIMGPKGEVDADKLNFLLDLDKGNPEAVKQLLKSKKLDPVDLDMSDEKQYQVPNRVVDDKAANFDSALSDLTADPEGLKTVQTINSDWDDASKNVLWENPELLQLFHMHRSNGYYDRVAAEVERQKTLGQIPSNTPFLNAYKAVGEQIDAADLAANGGKPPMQQQPAAAQPIAEKAIAPKPGLKEDGKAAAAAPTRSSPAGKGTYVNPLSLSDDEFMRQMNEKLGR